MSRNTSAQDLVANVLRIRIAQQLINEKLKQKLFRVPVHLAMGHEAISAAVAEVMQIGDSICLTHRNIHYNLALADSFRQEIDELRLDANGIGNGNLGSMNMDNPGRGAIYTSSILGNNLCVAAGAAVGAKLRNEGDVVFATTGDGAIEEGAFYESLELAKSQSAPLIILVENNQWSLGTRIEERRCAIELDQIANAFHVPYFLLDGNNAVSYSEELQNIRAQTVEQCCPTIVEVVLTTLGSWNMEIEGSADGKFINYHHGASPSVDVDRALVISADISDPVYVLQQNFGTATIENMADEVRVSLESELR